MRRALMRRIMIIGGPGSGKSTLARSLGARLGLPVVHVDQIYWLPGWVERPGDEVLALARSAADGAAWVFDGNHAASFADRADRADLILFLDLPRGLRMWRLLRRIMGGYGRVRPDMGAGCPERLNLTFLRWAWRWNRDSRPGILARCRARAGKPPAVVLTAPRAVSAWLASMPGSPSGLTLTAAPATTPADARIEP